MSLSAHPAAWLPFDDLIEQLGRKGFRIGIEHNVRLQALLSRLGDQCSPADLKTLLCPLFATNAQQQETFYRAFDACYPWVRHEGDHGEAVSGVGFDSIGTRRPAAPRRWYLVAGLVAVGLTAVIAVAVWRTPSTGVPANERTTPPSASVPRPQEVAPATTQVPWVAWYAARRTVFTGIVIGGPLLLWFAWEWYRSRKKHLLIRKSLDKAPPYSWPVRADAVPDIYHPSELSSVTRLLHRRYQGESERLDVTGTIAASIASLGFPTFRYRRDSRLPEYLFLIDRSGFRDHQSHLYEHLGEVLRAQGLYVSAWFFDRDPRVCSSAGGDGSLYLEQLGRTFPGHRMLLFGTGESLLDPVTGQLADWHRLFEAWSERAILSPNPAPHWGVRELTLASQFAVVPATLDGLRILAASLDLSVSTVQSPPADIASPAAVAVHEITELRNSLGVDVFQWLCACAVYPELQWGLTLTLGALSSMPPGLVSEENLTKLLRLEWFRTGSIPDVRRLELISQLDPRIEHDVREAIVHVLEDSPAPDETMAASAHSFQIAYQRARLAPKDRKARANLKTALEDLSEQEVVRDHAYLGVSESESKSPLHLVLPKPLRKVFYPAGVPWMGLRLWANLAMALITVVVGLQVLRIADRSLSTEITVTKPVGGTIVGPGIECGTRGSRCSAVLTTGQQLELNTQPDQGHVFAGYTGDCAPVGRTLMSGHRTCGATFDRVEAAATVASFRLTIMKPERGTVVAAGGILCGTLGTTCSADIPGGVPVSLKAEADDGYALQQFSGDCPATGEMTMNSAKTCGVLFVPSAAAASGSPTPAVAKRGMPGSIAGQAGPSPSSIANMPAASPISAEEHAKQGMPGSIAGQVSPSPPSIDNRPAAPPISAEEHAKQEIGQLVRNYCAALETLKPATIRALFHVDNQNDLRGRLREYKSLQCTTTSPLEYDRLDAGPAGAAQLKFGMKQIVEMRSQGKPITLETIVTMVVSRKDFQSPWLIDRVLYEAKPK